MKLKSAELILAVSEMKLKSAVLMLAASEMKPKSAVFIFVPLKWNWSLQCSFCRPLKFAGPRAHGVSDPKHQSPVPGHWSSGPLDSRYWSPEGYQNGILRRRLGGQTSSDQTKESSFWAVQKLIPNSITIFIDSGCQNGAKNHSNLTKNPSPKPSRNQTAKNNKKYRKQTQPNLDFWALACMPCWFSLFHPFQN